MYAEQLDRFSTVAAAVAVTVAVDSELATVVLRVAHGVVSLAVVEYNVCSANLVGSAGGDSGTQPGRSRRHLVCRQHHIGLRRHVDRVDRTSPSLRGVGISSACAGPPEGGGALN